MYGNWQNPWNYNSKDEEKKEDPLIDLSTSSLAEKEEVKTQFDLLKKFIEEYTDQKLGDNEKIINVLKKINHLLKTTSEEMVSMDEHIKYLTRIIKTLKSQQDDGGHPLYPKF